MLFSILFVRGLFNFTENPVNESIILLSDWSTSVIGKSSSFPPLILKDLGKNDIWGLFMGGRLLWKTLSVDAPPIFNESSLWWLREEIILDEIILDWVLSSSFSLFSKILFFIKYFIMWPT